MLRFCRIGKVSGYPKKSLWALQAIARLMLPKEPKRLRRISGGFGSVLVLHSGRVFYAVKPFSKNGLGAGLQTIESFGPLAAPTVCHWPCPLATRVKTVPCVLRWVKVQEGDASVFQLRLSAASRLPESDTFLELLLQVRMRCANLRYSLP